MPRPTQLIEVTATGPVPVLRASTVREEDVTVLNVGPGLVELTDSPAALPGEGFPLIPGAEFQTFCSGNVALWAVTTSSVPVVLALTRMAQDREPITFDFAGPVDWMMIARLPFYEAQEKLAGPTEERSTLVTCEWHGAGENGDPERGSFLMVNDESDLVDLVGERVQVTFEGRSVFAYVHRSAQLDSQVSLTRRLFMALAPLATTELLVDLAIVT